jgi:hypothetical protein
MGKQDWARPAVLLNPLEGEPTDADSHIGGPMLWPIDEPWPHCDEHREPLVGAVQLYARDFAELPFPDGIDLLQVFLCTLDHDVEHAGGPDVRLVWRDSTTVFELIEEEPEPSAQEEMYVPTVNVFEPIRYVEYPRPVERPEELRDEEWPETSNGSKIGGWTAWWQSGPQEFECPECGSVQRQTLSLATHEPSGDDVEWEFGSEGNLNILLCTKDVRHPAQVFID